MSGHRVIPDDLPTGPVWVRLWFGRDAKKGTEWLVGISKQRWPQDKKFDRIFKAQRVLFFVPVSTETTALETHISRCAGCRMVARGVLTKKGLTLEVRKPSQ